MDPKAQLIITFNHIILSQGFTNFSIVELAKKAGISRAKLYLYFKNKDEIVTSVVDRRFQFLEQHAVPEQPTPTNLVATILDALLLMGSSTDRFESELKQGYPQLYRRFIHGYQTYFDTLKHFYQRAQAKNLIVTNVTTDYLLFQSQLNVRGILQAVATGQIGIETGEQYLKDGFKFQLQALLGHPDVQLPPDLVKFEQTIIHEYYETYSLVAPQ